LNLSITSSKFSIKSHWIFCWLHVYISNVNIFRSCQILLLKAKVYITNVIQSLIMLKYGSSWISLSDLFPVIAVYVKIFMFSENTTISTTTENKHFFWIFKLFVLWEKCSKLSQRPKIMFTVNPPCVAQFLAHSIVLVKQLLET
jgi:hypothetical protein